MFQDPDDELDSAKYEVARISAFERRAAEAIRRTYDMLLDGANTGRYRWEQLHKTEKTHFGTLVEINLQREFKFDDGENLDYSINGIDIDCKYSHSEAWMIPPEAQNRLCFVVSANDQESRWSIGIVRAREEYLNLGRNRDAKATLTLPAEQISAGSTEIAPSPRTSCCTYLKRTSMRFSLTVPANKGSMNCLNERSADSFGEL